MAPSPPSSRSSASVFRHIDWAALGAVAGGGLIGSAARTGVTMWVPTPQGSFPTAVLVVNLTGSFLLGLYVARRERAITGRRSLQFWAIGVLGSFTTFSAFGFDVVRLTTAGRLLAAGSYVAVSVLGGLALVLAGSRIGAAIK